MTNIQVVTIQEEGEVQIFVENGPFEAARDLTLQLIDDFRAQGLAVVIIGEVEQHRDDGPAHVHLTQSLRREVRHEHPS